ncbi:MAG TPA: phage holin family protein [Kofleriaceae bacterium]
MDATPQATNGASEILHRIADDVKTIARDEVELVAHELTHSAKVAANEAAIVVLGGIVALIGFGLLCVAAVAGLAPLIGSLALRLVVMAVVYLVIGGAIAGTLAVKLRRDVVPNLSLVVDEARRTVEDVKRGLSR